MKFASILTILLIFTIAIAHAIPVQYTKRKLGSKLSTLGVSFEDSYRGLNDKVKKIEKAYAKKTGSFNEEATKAAKADNTEVPEFLTKWNTKYEKLTGAYVAISKEMDKKIDKLGEYLKANS